MSKPKKKPQNIVEVQELMREKFRPEELRAERIRLLRACLDNAREAAVQAACDVKYAREVFEALVKGES